MILVGVSGTVASGKNYICECFARFGVESQDADRVVHDLLAFDKVVIAKIKDIFPQVFDGEVINRTKLGKVVFDDKNNLRSLEDILHPIVKLKRQEFIKRCKRQGKKMVIINVPLLFENNIHFECDKTILVTASKFVQRQRFLRRANASLKNEKSNLLIEKFENILKNQIANSEKAKLADFIVNNGQNKAYTFRQVKKIFNQLLTNYDK